MESFEENLNSKVTELLSNFKKFTEKNNNAAGTRTRKNAQELKKMLQELRGLVLEQQKENKSSKKSKKEQLSEEE
jgi:hypothetical protein